MSSNLFKSAIAKQPKRKRDSTEQETLDHYWHRSPVNNPNKQSATEAKKSGNTPRRSKPIQSIQPEKTATTSSDGLNTERNRELQKAVREFVYYTKQDKRLVQHPAFKEMVLGIATPKLTLQDLEFVLDLGIEDSDTEDSD